MELTEKEIYDLNNRNVASQNVRLGDILATQSGDALTEKQMYDLTNDNVTTQKIEFGKIINAIATGNMEGIDELTEEQQEALNNIDSAFQNVNLGNYVEEIIENQEPPTPGEEYFLTFSSSDSFSIFEGSSGGVTWDGTIEYSTDKNTWNTWDGADISSGVENKLYLRGVENTVFGGSFEINASDTISINGNIENLLDYQTVVNGNHPVMANNCFAYLFQDQVSIANIDNLILGATTLSGNCYAGMFSGCTGLITLPQGLLPATTLASNCYENMFTNCENITTLPSNLLPATTLADDCYAHMFSCTNLTALPSNLLPATTLATQCYQYMFQNCTSLATLPILPTLNLFARCYRSMFLGCTSIKISETQDSEYVNEYRIPYTGEGVDSSNNGTSYMFMNAGGTFTGTPTINTTYYTSNTVV